MRILRTLAANSRFAEGTLLLLLALTISILAFKANDGVVGPTIQPDESSYLMNAAAIAGYHNDYASKYHAGYSLLLSPVYILLDDPEEIWIAVKLTNATLLALLVVGLWVAARNLVPEASIAQTTGAVVIVSVYPMWIVLSGYAFAQIAFAPVFVLSLVFLVFALTGSLWMVVALGMSVGFLYWIHPVGIAPVLAVILAFGYSSLLKRSYVRFSVLVLICVLMILSYRYGFVTWLHERMSLSGHSPDLEYSSFWKMLIPLASLDGSYEFLGKVGGHIFYLAVGSAGLFLLGSCFLVRDIFFATAPRGVEASAQSADKRRSIALYVLLSMGGVLGLSVLLFVSLEGANRLDHWMYGRYVEGVLAPILLIALLAKRFRIVLWAIPLILVSGFVLWLQLDGYTHIAYFNISAFWQSFTLRDVGIWGWAASGVILVLVVGFAPRSIALLIVGFLFLYSSYLQIEWHQKASLQAAERWDVAHQAKANYESGACMGFDYGSANSYYKRLFWYDFGFLLFNYELIRTDPESWVETCDGPLFSYDKKLEQRFPDVYAGGIGRRGGPVMYRKGVPARDIYPLTVEERPPELAIVLGEGWHTVERTHVWSKQSAVLEIPVPEACMDASCVVELGVSVYGASEQRPVEVKMTLIGTEADERRHSFMFRKSTRELITLEIPTNEVKVRIVLTVPDATSPHNLHGSADRRELGVALYEVSVRRWD